MEYYSVIKNENFAFAATWMYLEGIVPCEISRKDKYHMTLCIHGI